VLDVRDSPKIQDLLVKASKLEGQIKKLREKIRERERDGICGECYRKLDPGGRFCPYCAAPQKGGYKERF